MFIGEDEYGKVLCYTEKRQYSFKPSTELFTYSKYIYLKCSFKQALENKELINKLYPLLSTSSLCAGKVIREKEI